MSAAAAPADSRTETQKRQAGDFYNAADAEIQRDWSLCAEWLTRYNASLAMPASDRHALLVERFAHAGEGSQIRPPFHCDYGSNISLGAGAFLNFNCVILDVVAVSIGAGTAIGPGVQILTADHPRDPAIRATGAEFGRPIHIGKVSNNETRYPRSREQSICCVLTGCPCFVWALLRTCGLAAVRSCFPVSPSATMRSLEPAQW